MKTSVYRYPTCGHTERSEETPPCPDCSWDFMGIGRIGPLMVLVMRAVESEE